MLYFEVRTTVFQGKAQKEESLALMSVSLEEKFLEERRTQISIE